MTCYFTILLQAGTCAADDAPDVVPTATDAVLVVVSPRRTRFPAVIGDATQCFSRASTSRRVWTHDDS